MGMAEGGGYSQGPCGADSPQGVGVWGDEGSGLQGPSGAPGQGWAGPTVTSGLAFAPPGPTA